ncbi:MAG TPA: methyltransferase [Jatrophihabitans sp.]|nr:methyltransferase [Jatrophihabitans sp.]
MTDWPFDPSLLRRHPDIEATNLHAVDATDRLLLDTAAEAIAADPTGLVVIGDNYGALTLGAAARFGATDIRTHQDLLTGEQALAANARRLGLTGSFRSCPLEPKLVSGARIVLLQAPRSLTELVQLSQLVAHHSHPSVRLLVGGRVKYLTHAVNEVLAARFGQVQAGLARQKSRVITATAPRADAEPVEFPQRQWHADLELWVCAQGGAFAGTAVDIGTRRLVQSLDRLPSGRPALDLGCGTGVLAALLARQGRQVLASDRSAAACASAAATAAANGLIVAVSRDDALSQQPAASAELILCNPPFHLGGAVHAGAASKLFAGAQRVLRTGGQLWTVFNNHLGYRAQLERLIGPTELIHRDTKFSVTASTRR